ncbi:adenosylcobinamide amidohydrolase [Brevibacillus migulae]|uniref:adenosylcobinamide amidohydrolase n=1 Tax=Brevibacillus migulae TaxID=1644114 RepID=UPI00106E8C77|nr:adenosylcobinamide amidohydrolase [Brevibacillus migulae]
MAQPFRSMTCFDSQVWPDLKLRLREDHLVIQSTELMQTVSSALWRGGMQHARTYINGSVPLDYQCSDPALQLANQIAHWGYDSDETVGLLTAARLTHAGVHEEEGDQFRLLVCATAGTGNGARAGRRRKAFSAYQAGTINVMIMLDARLTPAAMINAVMTATEAKCAALQDADIRDPNGEVITGTTSDAIVLAASQAAHFAGVHQFAGTATTIGQTIGRLTYEAVLEAVRTQREV